MKKKIILLLVASTFFISSCKLFGPPENSFEENTNSSSDSTNVDEGKKFTVTWNDHDGTVLHIDIDVEYGTYPHYNGTTPTMTDTVEHSYRFSGWAPDPTPVTESITYTAQYERWTNIFHTYWYNYDGTNISATYNVQYGTIPEYEGSTPLKPSDDKYSYIFSGWIPTVVPATTDTTYTAVFEQVSKEENYFYLGTYPQTQVADLGLIDSLNHLSGLLPNKDNSHSWTSYNYYANVSTTPAFMWYQDISVGIEKYRGVYFSSFRPANTYNFANELYSNQDDNGYYINTRYWFKYEPIGWEVLSVNEEEGPLLVSGKIIDNREYYHSNENRVIDWKSIYPNNYIESNIRKWLNNEFFITAFSLNEQEFIKTTTVDNSIFSTGYGSNLYASRNTKDKLFLLSFREIEKDNYGFAPIPSEHPSREKYATDYAKAMGVYVHSSNFTSPWLLRSPSQMTGMLIRYVDGEGSLINTGETSFANTHGVVPALRINE